MSNRNIKIEFEDNNIACLCDVYRSMPNIVRETFLFLSFIMIISYLGIISILWTFIEYQEINTFITWVIMYTTALFFLYPLVIDYSPNKHKKII